MAAREVIARLTLAQRRALLWLPADGSWKAQERGQHQVSLWAMILKHFGDPERAACWSVALVRNMATSAASAMQWRLTPLGREVRAMLAAAAKESSDG